MRLISTCDCVSRCPLRGCPGILSYHISHHATGRVVAGSMEGLWGKEEVGEKPGEGEEQGEKEEGKEDNDQEQPKLKCK